MQFGSRRYLIISLTKLLIFTFHSLASLKESIFSGGYLENIFSFLDNGGCYQYANRTYVGCWSKEQHGIGYKQEFSTVYLGLIGQYIVNHFEFNANLKLSPWVEAKDVDQHYLRNLTFKEYGYDSNFYSAAISAGYNVSNTTKLFSEISFNQFTNGIADTLISDNDSKTYGYIYDAAGLSNKNYIISIGIKYTLD